MSKKMKEFLSVILAAVMICTMLPMTVIAKTSGDFQYQILIDGTAEITDYTGSATKLDIPSKIDGYTVTCIGMHAFWECNSLTSIVFPDSITSIGFRSFTYCKNLKNVSIPDSVTEISSDAFYGCSSLENITIPASVTSIGNGVFDETALYANPDNWNNGILYINNCLLAVDNDALLSEYTITDGTRLIADRAFYRCNSLESITIPDSVTNIGNSAFTSCNNLKNMIIPNSVASIGDYTFEYCSKLTSITIPGSVTSIGNYVFSNCSSLTSVTIPNSVTSIGDYAFEYCGKLTSITIPGNVTSIGNYVFSNCSSLTSVTIPNSVTNIGSSAFYACESLASVTIPDSVISIDSSAFDETALANDPDNWTDGVLYIDNCLIRGNDKAEYVIADGTRLIAERAFSYCEKLVSITIPDSVVIIGEDAFSDCTALTGVTIPAGVKSIGETAFAFCDSLESITIMSSNVDIGKHALGYNMIPVGNGDSYRGPVEGFIIYGLKNSTAQTYAKENGFDFIEITGESSNNETPLSFTQKHTVSNYTKLNAEYSKKYLAGTATAMDGSNGTPDYCIPGLQKGEEMVPQGIAYYKEKGWMLISAYSDEEGKQSVIYALDENTGKYVAQFNIFKEDNTKYTGHAGGIAVSDNNLYITNSKSISYIPLSAFNVAPGTVKDVVIQGSRNLGSANNNAGLAYVTITDGILYTGNFYYANSSDYNTPASSSNNSLIFSFTLSGSSSESEWKNFEKANAYTYRVPNSISKIQSASVKDGTLFMVSSYGRTNISTLYVVDVSSGKNTFSASDAYSFSGMPMMESMVFRDGYMYTLTESAAYKYYGKDKNDMAKDPTDVIWRIDCSKLIVQMIISTVGDNVATFKAGQSVSDILAQLENVKITDKDGKELTGDALIGTGATVQVLDKDGAVLSEYTALVPMDVSGDGKITAADARTALRASAQLNELVGVFGMAADTNGDDKITASDARKILRVSAKLEA